MVVIKTIDSCLSDKNSISHNHVGVKYGLIVKASSLRRMGFFCLCVDQVCSIEVLCKLGTANEAIQDNKKISVSGFIDGKDFCHW